MTNDKRNYNGQCACGRQWGHTGKHNPVTSSECDVTPIVEVIAERRIGWFKFSVFALVTTLLALSIAGHAYVSVLYSTVGMSDAQRSECKAMAFDQLSETVKAIKQATK